MDQCDSHSETGKNCPTDTVCFHAQQCVEKYLKALLVYENKDVSRTHSIKSLILLLAPNMRPDIAPDEQEFLSDYAVFTRYPGDYEAISLDEARYSVQVAGRVRKHVLELLPDLIPPGDLNIPKL